MSEPQPPIYDDQEGPDELVPSRYYKVAIALDTKSDRLVIPSEAVLGSGPRYQCYICRQFVRLCAKRNDELRPRELWFFKHAPNEASNCGGESYDHALATAVATWLLTRHVEGDTTVQCQHTCDRCDESVTATLPRTGLRPSIGHAYQHTEWRCDAALLDADDKPHWGLEILHANAVDREKAKGIPCPWAEVEATAFREIISDNHRYSQKIVTLIATQGRPDEGPMQPNGRWFCPTCRAKTPAVVVPPGPVDVDTPLPTYASAEVSRRAVVRSFATMLRRASRAMPLRLHHQQSCQVHSVPLVTLIGEHLVVRHVETPRQNAKTLAWDLITELRPPSEVAAPWLRIGIMIVGRLSHPLDHDGAWYLPTAHPFLVFHQQSIQKGDPTVVLAERLQLPAVCLSCREAERRAAAEQERLRIEAQSREHRLTAFRLACLQVAKSRRELDQLTTRTPDDSLRERLRMWQRRYEASDYTSLLSASRSLRDSDLDALITAGFMDSSFYLPKDPPQNLQVLLRFLQVTYSGAALIDPSLKALNERQALQRASQERIAAYNKAAREAHRRRRDVAERDPYPNSEADCLVPDWMAIQVRTTYAALVTATVALTDRDVEILTSNDEGICDPFRGYPSELPPDVIPTLLDRIKRDLDPEPFLAAENVRGVQLWQRHQVNTRRTVLYKRLADVESRIKHGFDPMQFASEAALDTHLTDLARWVKEECDFVHTEMIDLSMWFGSDPTFAAIPNRLARCAPFEGTLPWKAAFPNELATLLAQQEERRTIKRLQEVISGGTHTAPVAPQSPPKDFGPDIAKARDAIAALATYLSSRKDGEEWEGLSNPEPHLAQSAIRTIPSPHRPTWMARILEILEAPMLRYSSAERRQKVMIIIGEQASGPPAN